MGSGHRCDQGEEDGTMMNDAEEKFVRLTLRNPTPHGRKGVVITDWHPIRQALGLATAVLGVRVLAETAGSSELKPLRSQIDRCDTSDPTRDLLVFALEDELEGGSDDYSLRSGTVRVYAGERDENSPATVTEFYTGIKFENEQLEVFWNTEVNKPPDREDTHYFGGAVTSVRHYGIELLDAFAACLQLPHHPEKRCMQVDRVHLVRPPWDLQRSVNMFPFRTPWRKVFVSRGPVRVAATIASRPYVYTFTDAYGSDRVYDCEVFRMLTLQPGCDWVTDEVWVKATLQGTDQTTPFWFTARYFMMAQLSINAWTFRYPDHPGWFALSCPEVPKHGYAFATDARAGALWNPPLDYADPYTEHRAYEWELGTSRHTHCVHVFRLGTTPEDLADAAGRAWYDFSFRPIRATLEAVS
jgi:hypothetical protein